MSSDVLEPKRSGERGRERDRERERERKVEFFKFFFVVNVGLLRSSFSFRFIYI